MFEFLTDIFAPSIYKILRKITEPKQVYEHSKLNKYSLKQSKSLCQRLSSYRYKLQCHHLK